MTEPERLTLDALIAKWREQIEESLRDVAAGRYSQAGSDFHRGYRSALNGCADELASALRADAGGPPLCTCSEPSEEGTMMLNPACPEHGHGTPYAEAKRRYWASELAGADAGGPPACLQCCGDVDVKTGRCVECGSDDADQVRADAEIGLPMDAGGPPEPEKK